jgi:thioredoxin reductase
MANKAMEGRAEDVRPCLSCNQMCWGRRYRDYWISCVVNPSSGREFEWGGDRFTPAGAPRDILVVGGGPAGMEAARVAAERGHSVTLAEATPQLGGQFRLAGLQPRRSQILELIDWYERQLDRLGVTVRLNTYIEAADIDASLTDTVIVATGSLPAETGFQKWLPEVGRLPGVDLANVCPVEDVLTHNAKLGEHVVILDDIGDWRSAGTAYYLAEKGHRVTLVTADAMVARGLQRSDADLPLRRRLSALGVDEITDSVMLHWNADGARLRNVLSGAETTLSAHSLVLATVNVVNDELVQALRATSLSVPVIAIGDCVASRSAAMAIYEGRRIAREL